MANPRLSEELANSIREELLTGKTHRTVAKKLGVGVGTVSNIRKQMQEGNKEIVQLYGDALAEITRLKTELSVFTDMKNYAEYFQPVDIKPKHGSRGEATAVICVNDWHFEEEVLKEAVNGVNEFNLNIARNRAKIFWSSAASLIDMCRSRSIIQTIVVNILGDLVSGFLHDDLTATNTLTPAEATQEVFDQLVSGLEFLQKETKAKLIVPCVCGNHGRFTKRSWNKKRVGTSFEGLLYGIIARWFTAKQNKNIQIVLPQGAMTYITVYDKTIRLLHGDDIRYYGGIGGVHIPLRKAIDTWNTFKRADYNYLGHWHTDLSGEDYRLSGSLIGYNEYSIKIKARYQKPSQAFEIIHPKYGITARFPIVVK